MTCRWLAAALLAGAGQVLAADSTGLAQRQERARQEQAELQARIKTLQRDIERQEASRQSADQALRESETAISDTSRRLQALADQEDALRRELDSLAGQTAQQRDQLQQRRGELADQLRAQYTSGLSPWTALLSGNDPHEVGRDLAYLGYVSAAQTRAVSGVTQALDELDALQARARTRQKALDEVISETQARGRELEQQKDERSRVLAQIDADLRKQRGQAQRLAQDEARLGQLIDRLAAEIAHQAELARQAEEKRRQEAARRAEEARQAALEQQRALEREQEKARQARQAAERAREQAERERLQAEASRASAQAEQARREAREADRAAAQRREEEATLKGEVAAAGSAGAMRGLSKPLPKPVNGSVQGRFGAQRPEGGVWRGIVLRVPEGTHVRAVASGRVVYASWLSGFGNLIIVDHGQDYLSVYAYNQGLLKEVGDAVGAGDVIASAGATGGQVEPGLYFEIRHQGKPVNPQLWLNP